MDQKKEEVGKAMKPEGVRCRCDGPCFAKIVVTSKHSIESRCRILNEAYQEGHPCPFQKEFREVTNGKCYPYVQPEPI